MTNKILTQEEVLEEIAKPLLEAYRADLPVLYREAREAFANGESVYRTEYYGIAVELTPDMVPSS